jgi:raffinose/stachyose/melibiose transport system permease protein
MKTIPLAISMFFQQYGAKWNLMAASSVIGVAPAIITFIIFQRYFVKGITSGSVKG